jgi:hypothetical protein
VCKGNENSKPIWNKFIIRKDIIETSQVVLNFCRTVYLDLEYPQFESFHFKLVLKGLSRLNPHCPNQAQPITPYMLCDMFKHFDMSSPIDATVGCLF